MVEHWLAFGCLLVRVVDVAREVTGDLDVLLVGIGPNPFVALEKVLLFQGEGVEVDSAKGFDQYIGELSHDYIMALPMMLALVVG